MNVQDYVAQVMEMGFTRSAADELVQESLASARKKKEVSLRLGRRRNTNYLDFLKDASPEMDWDTAFAAFLSGIVDRILAGELLNVAISLPPRSGKSELVTIRLPVYWLETRPRDRVIIGAYNHKLAKLFTSSSLRLYRHRNSADLDSEAEDEWSNVHTGSVRAVGVGTGVTGFGADLILIDDPTKSIQEAFSKAYRDRVWNWYVSDLRTRRNNLATTPVIVIATRWHCLVTGSKVNTDMGTCNIENLGIGQKVVTSQGLQTVLKKRTDRYIGKIYSIRVFGYPHPLSVTPEHRILTSSGWQEAKDLQIGQSVLFPVPQGETTIDELRALLPEPRKSTATANTRMTGAKNRVNREEFVGLLESGMTYEQVAKRLGFAGKSSAGRYARLFGVARSNHNIVKGDILTDPDFWYIVGTWIAEGTVTYGRKGADNVVRITLGYHEESKAVFIKEVMSRYGISVRYNKVRAKPCEMVPIPRREFPGINVTFSSTQIAEFMGMFGKGAQEKFLPEWSVLLPSPLAQRMIDGYLHGDGFIDKTDTARISSVSLGLLVGFQRLLLRLGVISQIMKSQKIGSDIEKSELRFRAYEAEWMGIKKRTKRRWSSEINGNNLEVAIKSIEITDYDGFVHDIQTPCHDFVGHGMTIHNSEDLIGKILQEAEPGEWMEICIPAIAGINDPLGRLPGESINPVRLSLPSLERERRLMGPRFESLYQGKPIDDTGTLFKIDALGYVDEVPLALERVRFWDRAASDGKGDWTVGVLMAHDGNQNVIVEDVIRGQWPVDKVRSIMRETLMADLARYGEVVIVLPSGRLKRLTFKTFFEREPGGDGKTVADDIIKEMSPHAIYADRPSDNKTARASGYAVAFNAGRVKLKRAPWNHDFVAEHLRFVPDVDNKQDDQVDGSSGAYNKLLIENATVSIR